MANSTLKTSVAPTALLQTRDPARLTFSPCTFRHLMDLPVEIRLLIYNELMVHNVDLYRAKCYFCPLPTKYDNPVPYHDNLACAQILRTSKQIYSETLPILYSKNMVHIKCLECEKEDYLRMKSSPFWPCLVEGNDITTELIEHFRPHVKHIATACRVEQFKLHNPIAAIPARWPMMEHEILARYKNIERIRLRTRVWFVADATFDLVRRSYKSTAERVYDYKSVLALEPKVRTSALAVLEQICDEVILSHAQGQLKNTQFAVQSIRWKPSVHTKEIVLYLGCEHHCASDTANNQLLAGPDIGDKKRSFKANAYIELAGI